MSVVVEFLRAFNRKERYFLVKAALGGFNLAPDYKQALSEKLGLEIPDNAFVAMDYHLTWLYASVFLAGQGLSPESSVKRVFPNQDEIVRGNQEDIDLLVAFDEMDRTHVIIVEAKGVTGWTNSQLKSKASRLGEIFGSAKLENAHVIPHFVLTSPRESAGIDRTLWPAWMREGPEAWIELPLPNDLLRVTRSDNQGRSSRDQGYWTVLKEGRGIPLAE